MKYAGFGPRALALFVDILVWLPFIAIFFLFDDSRTGVIIGDITGTVLTVAYPVYMHGRFGQTIGKMVARIEVRLLDGSPITWAASWKRSAVDIALSLAELVGFLYIVGDIPSAAFESGPVDWTERIGELRPPWLRIVAFITYVWVISELVVLLTNEKRRALHDFIAGTVVTRVPPGAERTSSGKYARSAA